MNQLTARVENDDSKKIKGRGPETRGMVEAGQEGQIGKSSHMQRWADEISIGKVDTAEYNNCYLVLPLMCC